MLRRRRILWPLLAVGIAAALLILAAYLSFGCQRTSPSSASSPSALRTLTGTAVQDTEGSGVVSTEARSIDLDGIPVQLSKAYYKSTGTSAIVEFTYTAEQAVPLPRVLTISRQSLSSLAEEDIFDVRIADTCGLLLFDIEVRTGSFQPNSIWMTEKTAVDSLTLCRTLIGARITEVYNFNGDEYTVTFTKEEMDRWRQSTPSMAYSEQPGVGGCDVAFSGGISFGKFENLWRHIDWNCSLFDNLDGEIMVQLLQSEDFLPWLQGQLGLTERSSKELDPAVQKACRIASYAASLKCKFGGGPQNPACVAALGVVAACLIAEIADAIMN